MLLLLYEFIFFQLQNRVKNLRQNKKRKKKSFQLQNEPFHGLKFTMLQNSEFKEILNKVEKIVSLHDLEFFTSWHIFYFTFGKMAAWALKIILF